VMVTTEVSTSMTIKNVCILKTVAAVYAVGCS
jgi:hypothetical protein